jgi:uncharacterized membrane-anchored protein
LNDSMKAALSKVPAVTLGFWLIKILATVLISLAVWHKSLGTILVSSVHAPKAEIYYWVTITFSQTLGTALGDWIVEGSLCRAIALRACIEH